MTPVPFICLNYNYLNFSKQGMRYAKVLPEPVLADPSTSLPLKRCGRVRA